MQLFKYSETVGLPVVCAENGKKAGVIKDIIFNPSDRVVKSFLLDRKGIEIGKKQVSFKNVLGLGRDALVISDESSLEEYTRKDKSGDIIGLRVFERSGNEVGTVADVDFDIGTGRVESIELSDGLFQDLVQGRNIMPLLGKVEFGEENIIVEKEAVEEMVNNGRGIKNGLLS